MSVHIFEHVVDALVRDEGVLTGVTSGKRETQFMPTNVRVKVTGSKRWIKIWGVEVDTWRASVTALFGGDGSGRPLEQAPGWALALLEKLT